MRPLTKIKCESPAHSEEVSLIFRWLEVVRSLPPPDDFEPSENQATKKWTRVLTPPPRETQAGEYEVIVPAFPRACLGWGFKWLVHNDQLIVKCSWTVAHETFNCQPTNSQHMCLLVTKYTFTMGVTSHDQMPAPQTVKTVLVTLYLHCMWEWNISTFIHTSSTRFHKLTLIGQSNWVAQVG